ncbi:MAG: 50S ribosomal protein L11 methyltransferase [Defluviitaleaceae bacterium]|nr:50S ribosomal protein L11 methyltransferase [Defluviitaleaceae bacterium]
MKWTKIRIHATSSHIDALAAWLPDFGIAAVEIIDPQEYAVFLAQDTTAWDYVDDALVNIPADDAACVVCYLPADAQGAQTLVDIKEALPSLSFATRLEMEFVDDADWLEEWKKHFVPIRVGRVTIVPAWDVPPQAEPAINGSPETSPITFVLDPGSAFGTGQHATTYLCVEALQNYVREGHVLLDAGCGSGILSVIGLQLGAAHVTACDIDPSAISSTHKNAALNSVGTIECRAQQSAQGIQSARLEVLHGNIITDKSVRDTVAARKYDVIVANIVADVVIALLPLVPVLLKPGGIFIASGIIDDRAADVHAALPPALSLIADQQREGWHCLVCIHA